MKVNEIYEEAGLTAEEVDAKPGCIHDTDGSVDFYDSSAYEKLYEYFAFEACEMPYGVAKARTGTPDEWILEKLEVLHENR